MQSGEVEVSLRQSGPVKCSAVHFSLLQCCPAQSSPLHSHRRAVQSIQWNLRPSSPFNGICARPVQSRPIQFQFIPFQLSSFQSSIAQVYISQQQSSLVQSSAVQSSAIRNSSAPSRPVPSNPEQLTAVESSTTQSCSVKLGTTKCVAARPFK